MGEKKNRTTQQAMIIGWINGHKDERDG